jgi:hypothetical protein
MMSEWKHNLVLKAVKDCAREGTPITGFEVANRINHTVKRMSMHRSECARHIKLMKDCEIIGKTDSGSLIFRYNGPIADEKLLLTYRQRRAKRQEEARNAKRGL